MAAPWPTGTRVTGAATVNHLLEESLVVSSLRVTRIGKKWMTNPIVLATRAYIRVGDNWVTAKPKAYKGGVWVAAKFKTRINSAWRS